MSLFRSILCISELFCQPTTKPDNGLRQRLKALATQYPRYGYLMLHGLLRGEGWVKNRKRTYRLYTEEGLQVRTKKRKKLTRPRQPRRCQQPPINVGLWTLCQTNSAMVVAFGY
ncbi:transposase [Shewanella algae]|nr:transposase [Shewanella algae]